MQLVIDGHAGGWAAGQPGVGRCHDDGPHTYVNANQLPLRRSMAIDRAETH
jgi:hypothetical protein